MRDIFRNLWNLFRRKVQNSNICEIEGERNAPPGLEEVEGQLREYKNLEDILAYTVLYYSRYYSLQKISHIYNVAILARKCSLDSEYSLKLMIQLYFYLLLKHDGDVEKDIDSPVEDLVNILFLFINALQVSLTNSQLEQSIENRRNDNLQSYLNYHLDFRKELWEYYEISRIFNEESIAQYGFSVFENFEKILYILCNVAHTPKGEIIKLGEYSSVELDSIFSGVNYNNLFIEPLDNFKLNYLTESLSKLNGAIGIKKGGEYFLPVSEHVLMNIERKLIESSSNKGDKLERELRKVLERFFGEQNVYHSVHLKTTNKEEQDFIVVLDDNIMLVECKARDFKEIPFMQSVSEDRRKQLFKKVIISAAEQANRAKNYILENTSAVFTDDKGIKKLTIRDGKNKKIYKVVVTFDDFHKLSEMSINYFNDREENNLIDTWVINYFDFQRILSHSGLDGIFDYISYRASGIETINSLQASELAQYGYYISKNYHFIPPNGSNIEINLNRGFEDWSLLFDSTKNKEAMENIGVKTFQNILIHI